MGCAILALQVKRQLIPRANRLSELDSLDPHKTCKIRPAFSRETHDFAHLNDGRKDGLLREVTFQPAQIDRHVQREPDALGAVLGFSPAVSNFEPRGFRGIAYLNRNLLTVYSATKSKPIKP